VGQIDVRFDVAYDSGSTAGAFTLPAGASNGTSGWVVNKPTVAKYVNKAAPGGPTQAKVAVIKSGKLLKLVGRGLGDVPLDVFGSGDPGAGGVQTAYCVTNAGEKNCHCSLFSGCTYKLIAAGTGAKLVCKTGVGDPACGAVAPPTTTTTTSTSTTTATDLGSTSTSTSTTIDLTCFSSAGDGTVIDTCRGLQWEQKTGTPLPPPPTVDCSATPCPDPHAVNDRYQWSSSGTAPDGGLFTDFLDKLNNRCRDDVGVDCSANGDADCAGVGGPCGFAGHRDWRVPSAFVPQELETIVDQTVPGCGTVGIPCIPPLFGPTMAAAYWAGNGSINPNTAFTVSFATSAGSSVFAATKTELRWARAVRTID